MSCWRTTTRPRSTRRPSCSGDGAPGRWWQPAVGGSQLCVHVSMSQNEVSICAAAPSYGTSITLRWLVAHVTNAACLLWLFSWARVSFPSPLHGQSLRARRACVALRAAPMVLFGNVLYARSTYCP